MTFEVVYDILQRDVDYQQLLKPILRYLNPKELILDAGCGTGHILSYLHHEGYNIIGLDNNPAMIKQAKQKANVPFLRHDLNEPLMDTYTQIISLLDVIHYFKDPQNYVKNLYNALTLNGYLILDIYCKPINEVEIGIYDSLSYEWQVTTQKKVIQHTLKVDWQEAHQTFYIQQFLEKPSYYMKLLKNVGFKVHKLRSFDDRKWFLVCQKVK